MNKLSILLGCLGIIVFLFILMTGFHFQVNKALKDLTNFDRLFTVLEETYNKGE